MGRVVLAALIALLLGATPAGAATYTVNRTDDPPPESDCGFREPCTFREAVLAANKRTGSDAIVVRPGQYELRPDSSGGLLDDLYGDLDIHGAVKIFGSGRFSTWIDDCAGDRAMEIHSGAVEVRDLRITGCHSPEGGGAIATSATGRGFLELIDLRLDANSASGGGGLLLSPGFRGILVRTFIDRNLAEGTLGGGGVLAFGPISVLNSNLKANVAPSGAGGNVASLHSLSLLRSSLTGGQARVGGGSIYVRNTDRLSTIQRTTISGGYTTGPNRHGGGILAESGRLEVENVTIRRARATGFGGGIAAASDSIVTVLSTTVARSVADVDRDGIGRGGGLFAASSRLRVRDSFIAPNRAGARFSDCWGSLTSLGHNLSGRRCGAFRKRRSDIRTSRPRLGRFALHGAETKTYSLRRGSPAIDAGSSRCPARDQRNRPRRRQCDIGAFEYQGRAPRGRRR